MNTRQRWAVGIGTAVFLFVGLFPPHDLAYHSSMPVWEINSSNIAFAKLIMFWAMTGIVSVVAVLMLRDDHRPN